MNPRFKYIVQLFRKLPGVGPRQAARFVLSLLERSDEELKELGQSIAALKQSVRFCAECFNVADEKLCVVCQDRKRDQSKLLVVEKVTDLDSIEKTGLYRGLYHVLGGAINPVEGITPDRLRLKELENRIEKLAAKQKKDFEVILATNPHTPGETTALYIQEMFKKRKAITLTRLARGLASGSHVEYADETTLKNALEYRK